MTIPAARVKNVRVDRWRPDQVSDPLEQTEPLMVTAVAELFLTAAEHSTRHRKNTDTSKGGHICEDSKLFSERQHC